MILDKISQCDAIFANIGKYCTIYWTILGYSRYLTILVTIIQYLNALKPPSAIKIQNFFVLIYIHTCEMYKYAVLFGNILQYSPLFDNVVPNTFKWF